MFILLSPYHILVHRYSARSVEVVLSYYFAELDALIEEQYTIVSVF